MEGSPTGARRPRPSVSRQKKARPEKPSISKKDSGDNIRKATKTGPIIKAEAVRETEQRQGTEENLEAEPTVKQEPLIKSEPTGNEEMVCTVDSDLSSGMMSQSIPQTVEGQGFGDGDSAMQGNMRASDIDLVTKEEPVVKLEPL